MDKEIELVTLEDNLDYVILADLILDNNRYMVLSKEDNPNVVAIRKVISEDDKEYLVKINTEIEDKVKEKFVRDFINLE